MHLHPTVLSLIIKIGKEFGVKAIRLPKELINIPDSDQPNLLCKLKNSFLRIWVTMMQRKLELNNIKYNDHVFGIHNCGNMVQSTLLSIIKQLPEGITEIFSHPARGGWDGVEQSACHYKFEDEFQALISKEVKEAILKNKIKLISYGDL